MPFLQVRQPPPSPPSLPLAFFPPVNSEAWSRDEVLGWHLSWHWLGSYLPDNERFLSCASDGALLPFSAALLPLPKEILYCVVIESAVPSLHHLAKIPEKAFELLPHPSAGGCRGEQLYLGLGLVRLRGSGGG